LVLEDLAMAVFLPITSVLLLGKGLLTGSLSVIVALVTVGVVLYLAIRFGKVISRVVYHGSDEVALLTVLGIVLLVAGIAQQLQVSAAVGAFLVGIALSGPIAGKAHRLLAPLRDLFAAIFFLFFGLEINPSSLPPVLVGAFAMAIVSMLSKIATGWWAARRSRTDALASMRAGVTLVAHGEFSIVIAGLGVAAGLEPQLGTFSAAYVLLLAVIGPLLARLVEPLYFKLKGSSSP
jgi:CPA2 family monovalent cation:H+ antiporter-2